MTYFDQIDLINEIFYQICVHKPNRNNFYKLLEKKLYHHFPKFLTYDVILAQKIGQNDPILTQFWPFSPKMTYFDQIDPINEIFYPVVVHKPDWNNF